MNTRSAPPALAWLRRHWIAFAVVAALVALYAITGFFIVPRVAKSYAQDYVAKELGRKLSIAEIRFNPFTIEAIVNGLDLREADDTPIFAFKSLRVNAQLASLFERGVVLKEVRLEDPVVKLVVRSDGTVNLAEIVPTTPRKEEAPAPESPPPRVRISSLAIENGRVDFEDRSEAKPFVAVVEKIHFALADFRMDVDYKNAFAFSATTEADEQFEWNGNFVVRPLGSTGHVAIRNLRARTVDDYLQDHLPFKLAAGTVTTAADYTLALSPKLGLDVAVPSIALRDVEVKERAASAQETPVRIPTADLTGLAYSYANNEVAIKEVAVAGAHVDVRRERDGSISLTRLLASQAQPAPANPTPPTAEARAAPSAPAAQANPFKVRVDTIRLTDAAVAVEDRAVAPAVKVDLKPVALTVSAFSLDPGATIGVDGDITINEKGRLQAKGGVQLEPLTAHLDVVLRDLALPFLQPYLSPYTTVTLHSARLGVNGKLGVATAKDGTPAIQFAGGVDLADVRTTVPPATEDLLRWKSVNAVAIDYSSGPAKLSIDRVTVTQPYAKVVIEPDRTLNVAKIMRETPEPAKGAATKPEPAKAGAKARPAATTSTFPIRVRQIRVTNGSANFADYSIEPNFAAGIVELHGAVDGLSSDPASRAKVKLEGKVDKYAPVDISGELNVLAATKYTDVALNFRNMELTTFNPYSGKFAGYNITKGKLTTELRYKIDNRALQAEHHIVVDNLVFGEKTDSKDAAPIPVKLAVALLKDRKGIIDLQLPVRGSLDDPQFKLGPIIWKAVIGLLTKIVTAPFAAIGALFGGGPELSYVDFPAGAATIPAPELAKLDKLAKALVERPQLRLDVPHTSADRDADALGRAALDQRVAPGAAAADPAAAKRVRLAQLDGLYRQLAKAAPAYPAATETPSGVDVDARVRFLEAALIDRLKPDKAALDELGRKRAQAVQDALLAQKEIDPQRVFITTDRKAAATPEGAVRMELKLD